MSTVLQASHTNRGYILQQVLHECTEQDSCTGPKRTVQLYSSMTQRQSLSSRWLCRQCSEDPAGVRPPVSCRQNVMDIPWAGAVGCG